MVGTHQGNATPECIQSVEHDTNGTLQLKPCNDVKIVGYTKQSISIVGKIAINCTHADVIKKCLFYVTDITDTKVILGLNFCRAFNLVKVVCDEKCACQQVTIDAINEFPQGLSPYQT